MRTLNYLFNQWWKGVKRGKPNKRAFLIFLRMLKVELKCIILFGVPVEKLGDE
jgi:hypothetical protein